VARLRTNLLNPLPGQRHPGATATAAVLDEMMGGMIAVDADTCGFALGQIDEHFLWREVPDEDDAPLFSWRGDCRALAFMREGGI
jgi:hypothetical protein